MARRAVARRATLYCNGAAGGSHMRNRMLIVAVLLVLASGCGQKGPLYLPDDDTAAAAG